MLTCIFHTLNQNWQNEPGSNRFSGENPSRRQFRRESELEVHPFANFPTFPYFSLRFWAYLTCGVSLNALKTRLNSLSSSYRLPV